MVKEILESKTQVSILSRWQARELWGNNPITLLSLYSSETNRNLFSKGNFLGH
jgi:hypothetical protein